MMEDKTFIHAPRRTPALVALALAALAALALAAFVSAPGASAASGGAGLGGKTVNNGNDSGNNSECKNASLGKRTLRKGSCGVDVLTLHWFLSARNLKSGTGKTFANVTESSVIKFQKDKGLEATGVVNKKTVEEAKDTMKKGEVSYYGPGFWGNRTACGQKLKKKTIGVAVPVEKIKKFPCGSKVLLYYKGKWVRAKVIDTGGFGGHGRSWDLTARTAKLLNKNYASDGVFTVRAATSKK